MVEGSINAYLNGKKNLNWVVGIIRKSGISNEELRKLFSKFRKDHAENNRFKELERKCRHLNFL